MQIIYIVYREDNTMVFDSQVLEYLKLLEKKHKVKLILFRNYTNLLKKNKVESKVSKFVKDYITFSTFPLVSKLQLDFATIKLRLVLKSKIKNKSSLFIICRGELSTYIAHKALKNYKNRIILFDNRGLPIEELEMRNKDNILYKLNKRIKFRAIDYAKNNCDIYSFVTNNLREFMIEKYKYNRRKKYFIIPTLNVKKNISFDQINQIKKEINYDKESFYVIYIGSTATWQSFDKLLNVFLEIKKEINLAKLIILTNDKVPIDETIAKEITENTIVRAVSHDLVKYYLKISNLGLVIRDNNIVNKVAAPTKIAEYLSNNVPIVYDGEIGVINDLGNNFDNKGLIKYGSDDWLYKIKSIYEQKEKILICNIYNDYFDMEKNQDKLINEIKNLFS